MYVAQILYTWLLLESFTPTALTQRYRQRKDRRSGELAENENIRDGSALSERANSMQRPSELENLPVRNVGKGNQRWRHAGPIGGHADVFINGPYNNRMNVRPFDEVRKGSFGSKQYMPRTRSYYHGNAAPYARGFPIPYMPKERSSYSWNNRWSSMSSMQMYMPPTEERNYEEPQARPYSEVFPDPYTPEELPPHYWNYERPFKHPRMPFEGEDYIGNHVGPSDDVSKEDLISEENRNSGEDPATEEDRDPEDVASEEGRDMRKYARPNAEGFLNPHKSGVPPYYNWNNRRSLKVMQPYLSPVDKEEMRNYEETSEVSENDQMPKVDEDMRKHARPYMKGVRNTNMPGELPPSYEVFLKSTQQDMQPEEKDNTRIDEESSENFSKKHRFPEEDEEMQRHTRSYEEEVPNSSILGEIPSQSYGEPSDSIQQDMPFTEEITASPGSTASTMLSHSTAQTTPSEDVQPTITSTEVKNSQIETLSQRTTSTTLFHSNGTDPAEGMPPTILSQSPAQTTISEESTKTIQSYNLTAEAIQSNNAAVPIKGIKFETPIVCSMEMQWYRCRSARK
nr:Transmembrane channel-like protein 5 [Haemonchus contortus]